MGLLRQNKLCISLLDHIVEAQLKLLVFAEGGECTRNRPIGIKNRQNVADAHFAMVAQFFDAATLILKGVNRCCMNLITDLGRVDGIPDMHF